MLHVRRTDVLVIGGGVAGAMAAIHARKQQPSLEVTLLDKSKLETSGSAGAGMDAINTVVLPPAAQPEDFVRMLTKITEGVLDQEVAHTYAERCPAMVAELEEIMGRGKGELFPVDERGNYSLRYVQPIDKPMMLYMDGGDLKVKLASRVRLSGVIVHDRSPVLRLFSHEGRVAGALAFNLRTGDYHYFKANAVCLVAGCSGRMGLASSGYLSGTYEFPGNSGDGYALAYGAGAELVNMECIQALLMLKDFQGPACGFVAGTRGGRSANRLGQSSWTHPYPSGDSRLGVWRTYAEGKGPINLHTDHLPEEIIEIIEHIQFGVERTARRRFHERRGEDFRGPTGLEMAFAEEVTICGGHSNSGVNSDRRGATNVAGLYVAGDVDAGLPYGFLGGALVMGGLCGENAADYAAGRTGAIPQPARAELKNEIRAFEAPLHRPRGLPTNLVEWKARSRIQYYLKPPKNPAYMAIALRWMERVREEDLTEIKAVDYHDLLKVNEIRSILLSGEMMARASLFREESRWGYQHWRVDIPEKRPEWAGHWTAIRRGERGMELFKRPAPPLKWEYHTDMEYAYPTLSFDLGTPFQKGPAWRNPPDDPWMRAIIDGRKAKGSKKSKETR